MSDNRELPSRQCGVGDDLLERLGARLSHLLHVSFPSRPPRADGAGRCALAAALLLLLGAGGVAAQDTLPTVSVSDVQAYEDDRWIDFAVSLSHPSSEQVTVEFATSSGTATMGTDFRGGSQTLIFPPNRKDPRRVSVKLYDDLETEPDETFTVALTNPTGATLGDATATGTIRNDDTAATLTASDIEDTTATLTISGHTDGWWYRRDERLGNVHPCTAVTAGTTAVSVGGLTAAWFHEYTAFSDSTCATRLSRVRFWTLAPEGTPTVSISDAEASEDGTWMHFRVSLSQASREPVTVYVHTSSGTATSGTDFRAVSVSRTLTFPANSRGQAFSVRVYDDQEPEPDETFTVTLTNPTGATLGDATATGTIKDDGDTAARFTASDIEDTTATLTISGHTDGWWYRGRSSGTSSPWGACTAVTADKTAVGITGLRAMTTYEYWAYSDSGCSAKLANVKFGTLAPEGTPTVSISDAEASEDGKWIRFEVSLSQPSREEVRVRYETSSGTAKGGTDFKEEKGLRAGWVIFDANSPQITRHARVKVYDDQEPEPDETFTVTLTSATGATLGDATATGTIKDDGDTGATLAASDIEDTTATLTISGRTDGWWYKGRSSGTSSPWGRCTSVTAGTTAVSLSGLAAVTTYEYWAYSDSACDTKLANVEFRTIAPEGTPTVSVSDAQVSEDDVFRRIRFEISLSQPSREPVTVGFVTSSGTATSWTDFDARPGHVSFSANSPKTTGYASVLVYDDEEPEPDETFTLTLTRASNATLGDATTATGTIKDNDTGATLTAGDIEDTTATLTIADHTDGWWYKGNAHACTAVAAGTTAVGIGSLTAVTDYEYSAYSDSACSTKLARVAFRTLATEGVTPTVSVSDAEVSEDGGRMQFWVSLSQPSREEVTVDVQTSDGTATSGTDYRAESVTLTFPANSRERQLLPVPVHDDRQPEPDETFTVTLTNPVGATLGDATATGTIKDDGDTVATGVTAAFVGMPAEHDGKKLFSFELRFSEDFPGRLRYKLLRDEAFQMTNGRVRVAKRVAQRQNRRWTIKVRPASFEDVVITLPAATDCAAAGAVCTEAGRKLSAAVTATVPGPVAISVADAKAREGIDPAVLFPVTLSRAVSHEVTVRYRTVDGTAKAGEDYAAASGRLVFAAGEIEKAVRVPVRDDAHDERRERFRLRLSNPQGARIADGVAVGTIVNNDPLQKMWLSRFGRTVAIQTIEALESRFALASEASPRMTMTVAGQNLDLSRAGDDKALAETMTGLARAFGAPDAANDDAPFARRGFGGSEAGASAATRQVTGRELLHGSSFHFTTGEASGLSGAMTGWGKVLSGGSNGSSSGGLSFASETATGVLGMDWERDRLLVGVALSRSVETGSASFASSGSSGGSRYDIEGSLSTVTPYMRLGSGERLSFWGAVGSGSGSMSLSQGVGWQTADIAMRLAAAGARAELLRPGGGLALALKTDAFFVRTESERVSTPGLGNLAAATGDASRVRAVLEGSRLFALAGGGALEPSLELGLRHDGGDAETGTGVEFGGGVSWTDPGSGLTLEAKARMLAAHADSDYEEWGVSGAVRLSPGERGRGLSFSLAPTLGAASSGSERLWGARDARGLLPGTGSGAGAGGGFEAARGLQGELGYGLALSGNRFTGTPNLGFGLSDSTRDYRIGWRLTPAAPGGPGFEVGLDATRREAANDNGAAEHGVGFRLTARW